MGLVYLYIACGDVFWLETRQCLVASVESEVSWYAATVTICNEKNYWDYNMFESNEISSDN